MSAARSAPLLVLLALLACSDPQALDNEGAEGGPRPYSVWTELRHGVSFRFDAAGIEIGNAGVVPIYYFAADRAITPLILWGVCTDPETCQRVLPGTRKAVPGSEIAGWGTSNEVTVFWWRLVPAAGGGFRPDSVRAALVKR